MDAANTSLWVTSQLIKKVSRLPTNRQLTAFTRERVWASGTRMNIVSPSKADRGAHHPTAAIQAPGAQSPQMRSGFVDLLKGASRRGADRAARRAPAAAEIGRASCRERV